MKFYYFPFACSLASHVALEEIGLPFEAVKIDFRAHEQESPEYLAINPNAAVPALQLESGEVLSENIAILYWLAQAHPGAALWPGSPWQQARALEWMSWLSTSFHAAGRFIWRPERYAKSEEARAELQAEQRTVYLKLLAQAEVRLGEGPWVLGDNYSVADAHLLPYLRWARFWKLDTAPFPNLMAWHARMIARPAVLRALEREGQRP